MHVHRHMSMFISMLFCCLVARPDCPWQNLGLSLTVSLVYSSISLHLLVYIYLPVCSSISLCGMFLAVSLPFPVDWSDIPVPLSVPICQPDSTCACLSICACWHIYKVVCIGLQGCLCPAMILSVCVYTCADQDFSFSVDLLYIYPHGLCGC